MKAWFRFSWTRKLVCAHPGICIMSDSSGNWYCCRYLANNTSCVFWISFYFYFFYLVFWGECESCLQIRIYNSQGNKTNLLTQIINESDLSTHDLINTHWFSCKHWTILTVNLTSVHDTELFIRAAQYELICHSAQCQSCSIILEITASAVETVRCQCESEKQEASREERPGSTCKTPTDIHGICLWRK